MSDNRSEKKKIVISVAAGLSKAVLIALFAGAIVVAPGGVSGTLQVLNKLFDLDTKYKKKQYENSLRYLKSRKLVDIQKQYGKESYLLTKLGRRQARRLMKEFTISKPKKWDGKFRAIIFDIPLKFRGKADLFRRDLRKLGLANVQKSIWIHPYEFRGQAEFLAEKYKLNHYTRYIVAEEITGYDDLKRRFGL